MSDGGDMPPSLFPDLVRPPAPAARSLRERADYRVLVQPEACNLAELLSVLIGGQNSQKAAEALLDRFGTIQEINRAQIAELRKAGLSQITAGRLKAALAIGRRLMAPEGDRQGVHSPKDAFDVLRPYLAARGDEYLFVISLDTRNGVLAVDEVSHGGLNSSAFRTADIFKVAMGHNANNIVLGHNHPSGNPSPSQEDIMLTRSVVEAGKLMDLHLLDHIVIGDGEKYVSLKEKGLGFS